MKEFKGYSAYNEEDFLNHFTARRGRLDSPNNAMEGPMIYEMMGEFQHRSILDLGCGDATFGRELMEKGAGQYIGVEGSQRMVEMARQNIRGSNAKIQCSSMESFSFPPQQFDIVTSRMALHYIENMSFLFKQIHKALKDKGKFIFSVQHPLTTASFASKASGEKRSNWIVDDYFLDGVRKEPWMGKTVIKYHRTVEQYFATLTNAGFRVLDLQEGSPKRENFSNGEEYERRKRIPVVLGFSCIK